MRPAADITETKRMGFGLGAAIWTAQPSSMTTARVSPMILLAALDYGDTIRNSDLSHWIAERCSRPLVRPNSYSVTGTRNRTVIA
jgi:hypothetical protein